WNGMHVGWNDCIALVRSAIASNDVRALECLLKCVANRPCLGCMTSCIRSATHQQSIAALQCLDDHWIRPLFSDPEGARLKIRCFVSGVHTASTQRSIARVWCLNGFM